MPGPYNVKRIKDSDVCLISKVSDNISDNPILPGLPDDVSKHCLALVPRSNFPAMGSVSKKWRSVIESKEFITVRKLAGRLEEWLYFLTVGKESRWEVLDCSGKKLHRVPPVPGPARSGSGIVVLDGKLLVMAGYSVVGGIRSVSADVYQYDSCLNSWSKLSSMNVARYDFACAVVNGIVYAVGGCGLDGESLSSAEMYDPDSDKWTVLESLRHPRYGCFASCFNGKLYIMGGRSSFTIGNSRFIDIYTPETRTWARTKNGCVMVTSHAVIGNKLYCMEWKNERKLAIYNYADNTWKMVPIPVTGSSSIGFRLGSLDDKLLLFPLQKGYRTLSYDPNAAQGSEWRKSEIEPSGLCQYSVTIKA